MDSIGLTRLAFLAATSLSALLTLVLITAGRARSIHAAFAGAAGVQTLWLLAVTFPAAGVVWAEVLEAWHFCAWIYALSRAIPLYCASQLPKRYTLFLSALAVVVAGVSLTALLLPQWRFSKVLLWLDLLLAIVCLLNTEQLYRNIINVRLVKIFSLNLAAVFIYAVYQYSQQLIFDKSSDALFQVRASVSIVTSVLMILATIALKPTQFQPAQMVLSRPIVFYTTSLTVAGILLAAVSVAGYYMRLYGGDWGTILYALVLVATLLVLASVFSSKRLRDQLSVLIHKHFFSHKYDYRAEWLRLMALLSQPSTAEQGQQRALEAVCQIIQASGGALWLRKGQTFQLAYQSQPLVVAKATVEACDSPFIHSLETDEWIFFPSQLDASASRSHYNPLLPSWVRDIPDVWFILPLLDTHHLMGFMLLTCPSPTAPQLNWEDLDLLKTLGRQLAQYLSRQAQAEQLAEARQFEAFNKLSAYLMHDLKNLIAQQSLVVNNAAKHKSNPAFVEDAIQTISHSVQRMQVILQKLQHHSVDHVRQIALTDVLIEAVKRCQRSRPIPTLRLDAEAIQVCADPENLSMVVSHLIQNAQEATSPQGYVDVVLSAEGPWALVVIEDNGQGMDDHFIRNRLFRPFDSTKAGKGMGIGMYQARDTLQQLGGDIEVDSQVGEGTRIRVRIPLIHPTPSPSTP